MSRPDRVYVRFVCFRLVESQRQRLGLFQALDEARACDFAPPCALRQIGEIYGWFKANLAVPGQFSRGGWKGRCRISSALDSRMEQEPPDFTPGAATDEPASSLIPFEPVPVRARHDGWTPQKQREFVEALADTGVVREAAARVGMTEQSAWRLRRRADARAFDLVCEAALRPGARRLHAIAWERAIEGTIKRHYYHGELKSEERVYDNRLLIYLLGKTQGLLAPPPEAVRVHREWEAWMQAIEQGLPAPPAPTRDDEPWDSDQVWEDEEGWWTSFPPPAGFDGVEEGEPGGLSYRRSLSAAEQAVIDAELADEAGEDERDWHAQRDRFFGFEGGRFSSSGEPNL